MSLSHHFGFSVLVSQWLLWGKLNAAAVKRSFIDHILLSSQAGAGSCLRVQFTRSRNMLRRERTTLRYATRQLNYFNCSIINTQAKTSYWSARLRIFECQKGILVIISREIVTLTVDFNCLHPALTDKEGTFCV